MRSQQHTVSTITFIERQYFAQFSPFVRLKLLPGFGYPALPVRATRARPGCQASEPTRVGMWVTALQPGSTSPRPKIAPGLSQLAHNPHGVWRVQWRTGTWRTTQRTTARAHECFSAMLVDIPRYSSCTLAVVLAPCPTEYRRDWPNRDGCEDRVLVFYFLSSHIV